MTRGAKILLALALLAGAGWLFWQMRGPAPVSDSERAMARRLSLISLPPLPPDPSNAVADDPRAAALGEALFNDTGFSSNGAVACATCHQPDKQFQDGLPLGRGLGTTARRTMPLAGVARDAWFFWDGRADSLWAQALGPVESAVEHDFTRAEVARRIAAEYRAPYEALFGPLPDLPETGPASPLGSESARARWAALAPAQQQAINRIFANFAKSIAAYERTIAPQETRFDRFAAGDAGALSPEELRGFRLFVGKAHCVNCHNGPRMSDDFFHNTGVKSPHTPPTDHGRAGALARVASDPFNCLGPYSDAAPEDCAELRYMARDPAPFERAFKTPSLRGVAGRAPYMHAGQIRTLSGVVEHYNRAIPGPSGHMELSPLNLTSGEKAALVAFLKAL